MLIIGIAGGTGSGKTTVAQAIVNRLGAPNVSLISQDSYYLDRPDLPFAERASLNYDHPGAFENSLLISHLRTLKDQQEVDVPVYDFSQHLRQRSTVRVHPRPVLVVEGILVLADESLRNLFDIKIFVDTDPDVRVLRRVTRDIEERGRTLESVRRQYLETVKPMHDAFVEPSKRYADIIVPEGGLNEIAIGLVTSRLAQHVKDMAEQKGRP
ncbi:MAG: uridine kinase [Bacillota bacterium]|jgi:uridine kinase|nr:uridine kinase [Bacillota bacterium]